ncbi:MAG: PIN domain-containing protein, partial [Mesorhizobium sp.]
MSWLRRPKKWGWAIRIAGYTVILDACVLYPAPLRDFILELAGSGIFRARWTEMIHDEWTRNLSKARPDLDPAKLNRTRQLMNASVLGCLVEGYEGLIPALELPDPDDRHVLAAAIHTGADAIVTMNLKDFPPSVSKQYELEILHPDDFLYQQFGLDQAAVVIAARNCRARLKNPPKTPSEYLNTLQAQSLPLLVDELVAYQD